MLTMTITPEQYAEYHSPAPDYMYLVRELSYDRFGKIVLPESIISGSMKFIGNGRIVKISPYKSADAQVEYIKSILKDKTYVTFEFHAIAQVQNLPQFQFPKGLDMVQIHVKDAAGYDENLPYLINMHKEWEKQEEARLSGAKEPSGLLLVPEKKAGV